MLAVRVLAWGALAGLVHFVVIALLYANPITDRLSSDLEKAPAVRQWASKPRYFATQFFGTQVEVYPRRLLAIEVINGTLGTLAIVLFLQIAAI
jgi:hypothetical protein